MGSRPRTNPGNRVDQADGGKRHHESQELDGGDRQREEDAEHRAETGAGRDAQDVGRHERVAEQSLVGGTGCGNRGADQHRGEHAGQAHLE